MAAQAYIDRGGSDDREAIQEALGGHVCRCTGYVKIIDAVAAAARGDSFDLTVTAAGHGDDEPGRCGMKAVGARVPRYDGVAHVTGRTRFVDDLRFPGTLWVKAFRSPVHNALMSNLDTSKAEAMQGVQRDHAGRTSRCSSTATSRRSGIPADEPLLAKDEVRYLGQPIAVVAAPCRGGRDGGRRGDHGRLRRAARRSSTSARRSTPTRRRSTPRATGTRTSRTRWTAARSARATSRRRSTQADLIVQGVYRPAAIEHAPLETQVCQVVPGGQRPADDLLLHAGALLLDGRRRRAPAGAAEQAQVRRRHGRRRLRRQGRHGDRDDVRAARA